VSYRDIAHTNKPGQVFAPAKPAFPPSMVVMAFFKVN
jgi:hypothetical protein